MKAILKSVSRSFYLTIQFLPRPLRGPVSLAYLLARATDTIADTTGVPVAQRLTTLPELARVIAGEEEFALVTESLRDFASQQSDPAERELIEHLDECVDWLDKMEPADREDIRTVLKTIVRGQELDLRRFVDSSRVSSLQSAAELDEYTYLVAGCVGDFWTLLGFRHLAPFARRGAAEMKELGVAYGKGLQLINVLRDRGADLQEGRDYLPASEVAQSSARDVFNRWLAKAQEGVEAGLIYSSALTNWRVRFASVLPALIGTRTLALLRVAGPSSPEVKVPRHEVRRILLYAVLAARSPATLQSLFRRLSRPIR
ncbi:MAG: phytoene/squalene synthase family protein [Chthoniobacterales bacterium]